MNSEINLPCHTSRSLRRINQDQDKSNVTEYNAVMSKCCTSVDEAFVIDVNSMTDGARKFYNAGYSTCNRAGVAKDRRYRSRYEAEQVHGHGSSDRGIR